jgi:zinc/manganese transport system substrate-binding protein
LRIHRALSGVAGAAALALLAAAGLAGCTAAPATQATDGGTVIQVVAAENVWGEVAAQIGGPQVHVTDILGAASSPAAQADPETFRPSAAETDAIAGAQVFILNGAGLDPWADQAASSHPGIGRLDVNVGSQVGVTPGQDPYLWYDPQDVMTAAQQIEQDFAQLRPSGAAYFKQQVQAFDQSSSSTDVAMAAIIKQQFGGHAVGVCPGMAPFVATLLGLDPQPAAPAAITGKRIKVLLCDAQSAEPADTALLQAASTAKIPVVQLSGSLQPAGTTFQAWLTAQLNEIDQALAHG